MAYNRVKIKCYSFIRLNMKEMCLSNYKLFTFVKECCHVFLKFANICRVQIHTYLTR